MKFQVHNRSNGKRHRERQNKTEWLHERERKLGAQKWQTRNNLWKIQRKEIKQDNKTTADNNKKAVNNIQIFKRDYMLPTV